MMENEIILSDLIKDLGDVELKNQVIEEQVAHFHITNAEDQMTVDKMQQGFHNMLRLAQTWKKFKQPPAEPEHMLQQLILYLKFITETSKQLQGKSELSSSAAGIPSSSPDSRL